jgi:flavin reductase (DIM6/NTAB) family NADH-FMN oxidoreductase RutF
MDPFLLQTTMQMLLTSMFDDNGFILQAILTVLVQSYHWVLVKSEGNVAFMMACWMLMFTPPGLLVASNAFLPSK